VLWIGHYLAPHPVARGEVLVRIHISVEPIVHIATVCGQVRLDKVGFSYNPAGVFQINVDAMATTGGTTLLDYAPRYQSTLQQPGIYL
jgi:hypothetical protein